MLEQSEILDFESFDNQNGSMTFIVPNIVHLLYLNTTTLKFYQAINIYSIYLNHRPDLIYIHCDLCSFRGHFWSEINSISDLKQRLRINQITFKDTIFGVKYGWVNHHRSDVWRLLVLMHHGGIYLDTDVFVVNSLDKYRVYEMTVSYEEDTPNAALGTQVMIAHRNARLLKAHFDAYRTDYKPKRWFYNAGRAYIYINRIYIIIKFERTSARGYSKAESGHGTRSRKEAGHARHARRAVLYKLARMASTGHYSPSNQSEIPLGKVYQGSRGRFQ